MTKPLSEAMQDVLRNAVNHGQGWSTCRSDPIKTCKALFERGLLRRNGFLTDAGLQERAKLLPPQLVQTVDAYRAGKSIAFAFNDNPARSRAITLAKDAILDKARIYRQRELDADERGMSPYYVTYYGETAAELFKLAETLT